MVTPKINWRKLYYYSGVEFIVRKFVPEDKEKLPTGFIWLLGIYIAFFGVASNRYENRVDIIENRATAVFSQLPTSVQKKALSRIPNVQNMWCPKKPEILKPWTVFGSLFLRGEYNEMVTQLKETIEDWKDSLDSVDLRFAILDGIDFREVDLQNLNLSFSKLEKADLIGSNLENAILMGANLKWANFGSANLQKAKLAGANLKGAFFRKANLKDVYVFKAEELCEVMTLYEAELDQTLKDALMIKCPHVVERPKYLLDEKLLREKVRTVKSVTEFNEKLTAAYKDLNENEVRLLYQYSRYRFKKLDPKTLLHVEENNDKDNAQKKGVIK